MAGSPSLANLGQDGGCVPRSPAVPGPGGRKARRSRRTSCGRRGRGHRHGEVRPGRTAGAGARRRRRQRRLDAALRRDGRRHRQADGGGAPRRAPPPARRLAGDAHRERRALPVRGPRGRRPAARPTGGRWSWSVGRASTSVRCSTTSTSPAPTRRYGQRSRTSSPGSGRRSCTPGSPGRTRRRRQRSARRTDGGSCARWRSSRCAAPTRPPSRSPSRTTRT